MNRAVRTLNLEAADNISLLNLTVNSTLAERLRDVNVEVDVT